MRAAIRAVVICAIVGITLFCAVGSVRGVKRHPVPKWMSAMPESRLKPPGDGFWSTAEVQAIPGVNPCALVG
jgi:hypothetical protein